MIQHRPWTLSLRPEPEYLRNSARQPIRHPLEAEVIRMRAVHQAVTPGWPQQVGALHDFYVQVAAGNSPGCYLPDQFAHALEAGVARPAFTGRIDRRDHQNRSFGVAAADRFEKWSIRLS